MLKLQLETSFYGLNPQSFRDYDFISISIKTILHTYLLITYLLTLTSLANKAVTRVLNPCLSLGSVWSMPFIYFWLFFFLASLFCFPSDVLERAARVTFKYIILPSQFQRLLIKNLVKFSWCQILISDGIGQKYLRILLIDIVWSVACLGHSNTLLQTQTKMQLLLVVYWLTIQTTCTCS